MNPTPETTPTWAGGVPFEIENDAYAWCEDVAAHFWNVGNAAEMLGRHYTGWYTEDDGMSGEKAVGVVLEAKNEAAGDTGIYHAAILDPVNDGAAMVGLDTFTDANEAAHRADSAAEQYAEGERDYHAAWSAATLAADTIREARKLIEDTEGLDPARPVVQAAKNEASRQLDQAEEAIEHHRWRNPDAFDETFTGETGEAWDDEGGIDALRESLGLYTPTPTERAE